MKQRHILLMALLWLAAAAGAQQYVGMAGMLHVPTADMDTVGMARVGAHYIPKQMMPDRMRLDGEKFNSWTNYLSITPFRWIELGYGYTLWKLHKDLRPQNEVGFYAKDRYFSAKVQLLREDRWWPSVAVGGNDVWGSRDDGESGSNYYRNFFASLSKHHTLWGQNIGAHLTYRQWKLDSNHRWNGLVGGITFQPSFYQPLRAMVEWDGTEVNVGVDCLLLKYFLVQCALYDMQHFSAGLSLQIPLL